MLEMEMLELLKLLWPIIVIELALKGYSLFHLCKNGCTHLPKWAWALIILVFSGIGPIAFLIAGKRRY